jgi:uncharacterized protein (DUF2249 family)
MNQTSDSIDLTRFDVRDIPCRVKHAQIFQRWCDLSVGQHFVLVNDHDPIPLWYQFQAQFPGAFEWDYLLRGPDEFQVKITKTAATAVPTTLVPPTAATGHGGCGHHGDVLVVDARGLEPPEPLIRILNALEALPARARLRAITDRKPCHLFGEAEQRGFRHDSTEQPNGNWITVLERA